MPGKGSTELILWVVLLFPGPFYTLWRRVLGKKWSCPQCEKRGMVSVKSKVGRAKDEEIDSDISPEELAKIPDRWEKDREEYYKKNGIIHKAKKVVRKENNNEEKW
jgi:hypothetical protein